MKALATLILLSSSVFCYAQLNCKTVNTEPFIITTCHHANGKVSTIHKHDKQRDYGEKLVFDNQGKLLFQGDHGRLHGSATADFKYHANGQVSYIYRYTAPDAGIQWYKSETWFDSLGNVIDKREQSHDMRVTIPYPTPQTPVKPTPTKPSTPKQEVAICAEIWKTYMSVVNLTGKTIQLEYRIPEGNDREELITVKLKSGEHHDFGYLIRAEHFIEPWNLYQIRLNDIKPEKTKPFIQDVSRTEKRYMYLLTE